MGNQSYYIGSGIVTAVDGMMCDVKIGDIVVPGVRLRATEIQHEGEILLVPSVNSAVIVGSLTGDYSQLVVLQVDRVDSIKITGSVTLNGGKNGGLINIDGLTDSINALVDTFNRHTHTGNMGSPTTPPTALAEKLNKKDYEDTKITH